MFKVGRIIVGFFFWSGIGGGFLCFIKTDSISAYSFPSLNTELCCEKLWEACMKQSCKELWREVGSLYSRVKSTRLGLK